MMSMLEFWFRFSCNDKWKTEKLFMKQKPKLLITELET